MATSNSGIRILVVDDDPDILFATAHTLKKENYEVLTANNGLQCLDKVVNSTPTVEQLPKLTPMLPILWLKNHNVR